ncbi:hypothetical protein [Methylobacterium radiodurans]|uniref:Uncharacterized protein n=1 Tax=Methylobacterium radiodurans TaxID=2202828 RepID=A0A2U8VR36_9HYPH|nr:hypothetical protein [Methylobacterium radiodurans]AWN35940.1 hypothetical protein DK427_09505 [Methylobacterium radiodurans]
MRNDGTSPDGSLDRLGAQVLRVQDASLTLADELVLFTLGAQMVWFDFWLRPLLQAGAEMRTWQAQQARTARLIRRGIPEPLAREGLHLLPD